MIDPYALHQQQLKRNYLSADRIRTNLVKLNGDVDEKRKKLKSTQQTISKLMLEEEKRQKRIKEKLYLVQEKREQEQSMKALKLQEQLDVVSRRLEQRDLERSQKKELPSIKDIFIKQKAKEQLEKTLRKYEIYNKKVLDSQQQEDNLDSSGMRTQNMDSLFFNLTAPVVQTDSMAEKVMIKMKSQLPQKKTKEKQKQQINPFQNRQNWDRFMEAERNGEQNIRFPGIGIERTPLYEIQQEEIEKNKKKEEALQKLKKYYLNPSKKKAIDFESIVTFSIRLKGYD